MLIPVLGAGALVATLVGQRWEERNASRQLASAAEDVTVLIDAAAAINDEQAYTTVLVIGRSFGVEAPASAAADLAEARDEVDRTTASLADDLAPAVAVLEQLRISFDADELDFVELSQSFVDIHERLAGVWIGGVADVGNVADRGAQPAWLRAHLRSLRESISAVVPSTQRVRSSLHVDLGDRDPQVVTELLRANAAFAQAASRVTAPEGSAAAAWHTFRTDPAAVRLEEHLARSELVAFGIVPSPYVEDIGMLSETLEDGVRWSSLLTETGRAAAADLEQAARSQARSDERSMVLWLAGGALVAGAAAIASVLTARRLVRPVDDLAAASRQIAEGELAVEPVAPRGAQELVDTVRAFNDMAATLAAVEAGAVALASYPAVAPSEPLPGRTGRALQDALDLLQASVREVEQRRAELAVLASHDDLTGLLNRRAALDAIHRDLARIRRDDRHLALLYVDLDGLKALNDRYGHATGDEAIRAAAQALTTSVRDGDVVARLGGDEFVVSTVVLDDADVETLVGRVHRSVREATVDTADGPAGLRCSIGVAITDGAATGESVLGRADAALYAAKRAGRDRAVWAGSETCST